ncbi:MAG TPA: DUF2845 domain-containing protein [Thermodesulfovibrionales bacterium]|nr:DUF2845 domain-containing protein [Thermodesulfovibrionales bacterium]
MNYLALMFFVFIALPIEAGTDNPASDLRCGQYIISRGAVKSDVLRKCGDPSNIERWEKESVRRDFYRDIPVQSDEELSQEPPFLREQIRVEEWEYNFGPTRFLYYLRFENGKLVRITVGDYGY